MKRTALSLLSLVLLVSCALPGSLAGLLEQLKPQPPVEEPTDLMSLVANGSVQIISVRGNQGVTSLSGRTIDLQLLNNSGSSLEVVIPCGVMFLPTQDGASRMVTVQSHSIIMDVDEVKTVMPFVLSIDALKGLPTEGKTYSVEMLTAGKQLEFAECLCQKDLPAETETRDLVSLQLAAWMIADNSPLTGFSDELNDWLRGVTGIPFNIPGLDNAFQNLAESLAPEAQAWLDKCGIK